MEKDEIDRILPPTIDERIAEKQNEDLDKDKLVKISPNDNHIVHLEIHSKAAETKAKKAHVAAHEDALRLQRDNPELFPNLEQEGMQPGEEREVEQNQALGLLEKLAPAGGGRSNITPESLNLKE
jgi:hypothetical protein